MNNEKNLSPAKAQRRKEEGGKADGGFFLCAFAPLREKSFRH